MKHNLKIHATPEREERKSAHKPPLKSQATATHELPNLNQANIENLSREDILALQQTYGNQAVARLLEQRQGGNGDYLRDSQGQRQDIPEDEEFAFPGPRSASARESYTQPQYAANQRALAAQRAAPPASASGNVGDAVDLDGEAMYGWDRAISWRDVARVVEGVLPTQSSETEEMPRIVIFSGTHGTEQGDLVNDATSRGFVAEDQATADIVNEGESGIQVEVVDVVNSYRTMDELLAVYNMTDYIRILGWCYSRRSYGLGDLILSNWWPAPDSLP